MLKLAEFAVNENSEDVPAEHNAESRFSVRSFGEIGLALSIGGVAGIHGTTLMVQGFGPGIALAFCIFLSLLSCAFGLVAGLIGMFFPPRRLAIWATLIGFYGSNHIPTFIMFMFILPHRS